MTRIHHEWIRDMQVRRNDYDVTNRIQTTDPAAVQREVARLFRLLYPGAAHLPVEQAFVDVIRMYAGEDPEYHACDTSYHNIQHVMDVTLAMARLMDGYERSRRDTPPLGVRLFQLGVVTALFHDIGYLRETADDHAKNGAEYTLTHVSRGARYLSKYLTRVGLAEYAEAGAELVLHFTGFEERVPDILIQDPVLRMLGSLLGSADIIAQMSDRCYLEKCRDRLYPGCCDLQKNVWAIPEVSASRLPGFLADATCARWIWEMTEMNLHRFHPGFRLFEGRMIDAFDYRAKGYVSGRGRAAVWESYAFGAENKRIKPQWYVLPSKIPPKLKGREWTYRIGFCDVASPSNERSLVAALIPPTTVCGDKVPTLSFENGRPSDYLLWLAIANSLAMDFIVRKKVALKMSLTVMDSLPFPREVPNAPCQHGSESGRCQSVVPAD